MENEDRLSFPFTVRDMLAFEHGAAFSLRIVSQSFSTAPLIIRGMTSEGLFSFLHIPTSNSVISTQDFRISDIPIWVSVTDKDGTMLQGDQYITLKMLINGDPLFELCAGFVYRQKSLSWPQNSTVDMRPGGAKLSVESGANADAGANATIVVPAGEIWKILSLEVQLVTSAVGGNRVARFGFDAAGAIGRTVISNQNQPASKSWTYALQIGSVAGSLFDDNTVALPLPHELYMLPGDNVYALIDTMDAGDNWGVMSVFVEKYFNPA